MAKQNQNSHSHNPPNFRKFVREKKFTLMKIYTKTGDKGTTSLFGGTRVPKYHPRTNAYGTVDELNANIGMIRSYKIGKDYNSFLEEIQANLFTLAAELATDPKKATLKNGKDRLKISKIEYAYVEKLETAIDKMNEELPPLKTFILPGGHPAVSACHISRTVCRRAERLATALYHDEPFDEVLLKYLNRLSDYLFVLARKIADDLNVKETPWLPK